MPREATLPLPVCIRRLVKDRIAHFDVLAGRCTRRLTFDELRALQATTVLGKRVRCYGEPKRGVAGYVYRFQIPQPTTATIRLLQQIAESCPIPKAAPNVKRRLRHKLGLYLNRIEFALDLTVVSKDVAFWLGDFVKDHIVQLRSRGLKVTWCGRTLYLRPRKHTRPGLVVYDDRRSKCTGLYCVHVEWRESGAAALRRLQISEPLDLLAFDPAAFWSKRLILEKLDREVLGKQLCGQRRDANTGYRHRRVARIVMMNTFEERWDRAGAQEVRVGLRALPRFRPEHCMTRMDVTPFLPA